MKNGSLGPRPVTGRRRRFGRHVQRDEHQRLRRGIAAAGDPGRQRRRRRGHDRLQHHGLGGPHDRAGDGASGDHLSRHDQRLLAGGRLREHARHDAGPRHGAQDRDRRRGHRRRLHLPRRRGGRHDHQGPRHPRVRDRHPAPERRGQRGDRGQLPRDRLRRDDAVRVERRSAHRRGRAPERADWRHDASCPKPDLGRTPQDRSGCLCGRSGRVRDPGQPHRHRRHRHA